MSYLPDFTENEIHYLKKIENEEGIGFVFDVLSDYKHCQPERSKREDSVKLRSGALNIRET